MNRQSEARKYIEARHKVMKHRCADSLRRRSYWGRDDDENRQWKMASYWRLPRHGIEEKKPEGLDYLSKQTRRTIERLRRMQEIRKRVEENPFEAVFGRSVMRLDGDRRLAHWTRTLFNGWGLGANDQHLGKRGMREEAPPPEGQQHSEPQQATPSQQNQDHKDETQCSNEEFEFDPITMRRVPRKPHKSESQASNITSTSRNPKQSQSTSKSPMQAVDEPKGGIWVDVPVKKFSGYQQDSVIYIPETKTEGTARETLQDQTNQLPKDLQPLEKVPGNPKGTIPEEFESSWENVQASMAKRKMQYEQMSLRIGKQPQATSDSEKSSWLDREGFATASMPVPQQTAETPAQASEKSYYRPRPRHQLLSESHIRSKKYQPDTGELKGKALETAAARLQRRTDVKSDLKSHENDKSSARDPAEVIRHREILETLVEHRRRGTETMIDHAQRFIADLRKEMPERTIPEVEERDAEEPATSTLEGEGDLCKHVHVYAERSPLFNRSPATFKERAETEKRAWAKHDQKVKDHALVREIRGIYEDQYGLIDTRHRHVGPTKSTTSPEMELEKPVESMAKEAPMSETSEALPEQITYKILAFDPQRQEITSATSTSSSESQLDSSTTERIISVPEVLLGLNSPARFLPYFSRLQAEGYELIRGNGDVVVFKKVRGASAAPAAETDKSSPPAYSYRDMNPIDGTTTGNYASPTGFVNHDPIVAPSQAEEVSNSPKPSSGAAKVTRQEPVFSGGQRWQEHTESPARKSGRVRRVVRRVFWGAIWVGACSYAVGVVVEFFTTGGSGGLGAVGF
jgi:hypothetical protein